MDEENINQEETKSSGQEGAKPAAGAGNDRGIAAVAYVLFFVPMLVARESEFAMYHANQGLLLFLTAVIINIIGTIIPFLGWFLILPLGNLLVLVFALMGIIRALNGEQKPLPLIGGYHLLK